MVLNFWSWVLDPWSFIIKSKDRRVRWCWCRTGECQGCPKATKSSEYSTNCKVLCFYRNAAGNMVVKAKGWNNTPKVLVINLKLWSKLFIKIMILRWCNLIFRLQWQWWCVRCDAGDGVGDGDGDDDVSGMMLVMGMVIGGWLVMVMVMCQVWCWWWWWWWRDAGAVDGDGDVSGVMLVVSFHKGQMIESGEAGVPSLKDHKGMMVMVILVLMMVIVNSWW